MAWVRRPLLALIAFACLALASMADTDERPIALGDLLLVWARLRDCPDVPRLAEVVRIEEQSVTLLGLGSFSVIGSAPADVLREVRARYRERTRVTDVPPISIEIDPAADAQWEAVLLLESMHQLDCEGYMPKPMRQPDRPRPPVVERIAAR